VKGYLESGDLAEPESLGDENQRSEELLASVTFEIFNFFRQGLLPQHRVLWATLLALKVSTEADPTRQAEIESLFMPKAASQAPQMSTSVSNYLSEDIWAAVFSLQSLPPFANLCVDIDALPDTWHGWFKKDHPEKADLPAGYQHISPLQKILLVRAMRLDRLKYAFADYVERVLGARFAKDNVFSMLQVYRQSSPTTPVLFLTFEGFDLIKELDSIVRRRYSVPSAERIATLSMGQGQENAAEQLIDRGTRSGVWVLLQNVHVVPEWLDHIVRKMAEFEYAHPDFRLFLTADPGSMTNPARLPLEIVENSVKISFEPPSSLKMMLSKTWTDFEGSSFEEEVDEAIVQIIFRLCLFHSVVTHRASFGTIGWNSAYAFNASDLMHSADTLKAMIDNEVLPSFFNELQYLLSKVLYGGHITNEWDQRICDAYVEFIFGEHTFSSEQTMNTVPLNKCADLEDYDQLVETVSEAQLQLFLGMNKNASIQLLRQDTDELISALRAASGPPDTISLDTKASSAHDTLLELSDQLPINFAIKDIEEKACDHPGPFNNLIVQECERMNCLLVCIRQSLALLKKALDGTINMSHEMESLLQSLQAHTIPVAWAKLSHESARSLGPWFIDLLHRIEHLNRWTDEMRMPLSIWISGLFNPQALLTAIRQSNAAEAKTTLDQICVVIRPTGLDWDLQEPATTGVYVHGMYLDGAAWEKVAGNLTDQTPGELYPRLPVMLITTVGTDSETSPDDLECPVFYTSRRGFHAVCTVQLRKPADPLPETSFVSVKGSSVARVEKSNDLSCQHNKYKWAMLGIAALLSV